MIFNEFFNVFIQMKERGCINASTLYMYVLEHIVSLSYRTARWMFTKPGRDEVRIYPNLCLGFSENSVKW